MCVDPVEQEIHVGRICRNSPWCAMQKISPENGAWRSEVASWSINEGFVLLWASRAQEHSTEMPAGSSCIASDLARAVPAVGARERASTS